MLWQGLALGLCLALAAGENEDSWLKEDTRPFPISYVHVQMYKRSCTPGNEVDYLTLIPKSHWSNCTTYASFGTDTCTSDHPEKTLSQCRNTLSSVNTVVDGTSGIWGETLRWYSDLECKTLVVEQPAGNCVSLGHDLYAKTVNLDNDLPGQVAGHNDPKGAIATLTSHQVYIKYQANPNPYDGASTCTIRNHYYEAYRYGTCARVMYSDAVIYNMDDNVDQTSVNIMMRSYKTRDCSESATDRVIHNTRWRRDASRLLDNFNTKCTTAREHCLQGKTAQQNVVEAALLQNLCVPDADGQGRCRPGNVGDICNEHNDCKTNICGVSGDNYNCENRCVALDAVSGETAARNCPHMLVHDMHCIDREMGWPGLAKQK